MIHTQMHRRFLLSAIKANCGPVTITPEELLSCVGTTFGLDAYRCESLIRRKVTEAHDAALASTLGVSE